MSSRETVTFVRAEDLLDEPLPSERAPGGRGGLGVRRALGGLGLAVVGLPLLTLLLERTRSSLALDGQVLLYLLAVVVVALVGGIVPAIVSAVAATMAINYYFVEPRHTLDVAHADQAIALLVFLFVAAVVSVSVELAARRARAARAAAREAETLSALAGADLGEKDGLRDVLERARVTFGMESVGLKARASGGGLGGGSGSGSDGGSAGGGSAGGEWVDVETAGWAPAGSEEPLRFDVPVGSSLRLVGRGPELFASDQRVLSAFAAAAGTAWDGRRLAERAGRARELAAVDRQRTALLAAVGHDLRTPLAGIKAGVSSLRQTDVTWSDRDRDELLATVEESADRLDGIVANLLDASRLQAGALGVRVEAVALDEVVGAAALAVGAPPGAVRVAVPEDLPLVSADRGLLERVFVNLIDNAVRHGGGSAEVSATAGERSARVKVWDDGPGLGEDERSLLFEPFAAGGDRRDPGASGARPHARGASGGLGLGLWVARGFTEAMGGTLIADRAPSGGLLMRLRLPLAEAARSPSVASSSRAGAPPEHPE